MKLYLLITLLLINCNDHKRYDTTKKQTNLRIDNVSKAKEDPLLFNDMMQLSKQEAILKYGRPATDEQFIMDDAQGEFRNNISDIYTVQERQRESILINEVTWSKDANTWITVWYQIINEKTIPKSFFLWEKGAEF